MCSADGLSTRFALLRAAAVANIRTSAESLLHDLQTHRPQDEVESTLTTAIEYFKTLNRGLEPDARIQLNQNRR
jgi:hypothetical protein